jgi:hypothetical protein
MLQEVNLIALDKALTLLFGDEHSALVAKLYTAFDTAMKNGFELGLQQGQENLEAACDAAFDSGYEYGEAEGLLRGAADPNDEVSTAYDDGYLHGVGDARACPALADEVVQDILQIRAEDHFEAIEDVLER